MYTVKRHESIYAFNVSRSEYIYDLNGSMLPRTHRPSHVLVVLARELASSRLPAVGGKKQWHRSSRRTKMQGQMSEGDPTAKADTRECDQEAAAEAKKTTVLGSSSTAAVAPKQQTQEMQTSKGELSGGRAPTNQKKVFTLPHYPPHYPPHYNSVNRHFLQHFFQHCLEGCMCGVCLLLLQKLVQHGILDDPVREGLPAVPEHLHDLA